MSKYTVMVADMIVKEEYRALIKELYDDEEVSYLVGEYPLLERFNEKFPDWGIFRGPMMFDHALFEGRKRIEFTEEGRLEFMICKNYGEEEFFPVLLEDLFIPIAEGSVNYYLVDEQDKIFHLT